MRPKWKPALLAGIIVSGLLAPGGACADVVAAAEPPSVPVRSGCEPDYPPYCIVTADRQADGFAVELLRAALKAVGREVTFKTRSWLELKQDLAAGRLEALPLVGRTPEREAIYDFTFPYLTMHGVIVVRDDNTVIRAPADLKGKRVAVLHGDNAEEYLRRADVGAVIVPVPSFEMALRELSAGKHDAVVIQKLLAYQLMQQAGLKNLKTAGPPLKDFTQSFCFAVRKGNRDLLAALNEGLSIVMADGTFRQLYTKWFSAFEAAKRIKSRLVVGGDRNCPPYEFLDRNGQPAGFNVDLTRAIARQMGLLIEVRLGSWGQIRNGLETGEIDVAQGMFYSVERDKKFYFSPPNTVVPHAIVVRDGSPELSDMKDLAGKSILVMAGNIMEELAVQQGYGKQLMTVPSQEDALRLLAAGKGDCALVAKVPALYWIEKKGWRNLKVSRNSVFSAESCYAVLNGQEEMLSPLSDGLTTLKGTDEYRKIQAKWLSPYELSGISFETIGRIVLVAALPLLILLGGAFFWSRSLQIKVAVRTRELVFKNALLDAQSEASPDGILVVDESGGIRSCNQRFIEMWGISPELVKHGVDEPLLNFVAAQVSNQQAFFARVRYLYDHRREISQEELVLADGRVFDRYSAPIVGPDEHYHGRVWYFRDITGRKQGEKQLESALAEARRLLADEEKSRHILLSVVEDQRLAEIKRRESEEKFRNLYHSMNEGMALHQLLYDPAGKAVDYLVVAINPAYETILGLKADHVLGRTASSIYGLATAPYLEEYAKVVATGQTAQFETTFDPTGKIFRISAFSPAKDQFATVFEDITEHRRAESYRQLSTTVLTLIAEVDEFQDLMQQILAAVKRTTGCDAVGMRLRSGDDFPYFVQDGFSDDFLLTENTLVVPGRDGGVCRGPDGQASLACTCGLVLSGKTDPSHPLFISGGSFWTNDSTALLRLPAADDPRLHPRNRCIHDGYASVALIPIRAKTHIVGLLQLNSRKKDSISKFMVETLEGIAGHLGEALMRKQNEIEHERLMAAIEQSGEIIFVTDTNGVIQYVNPMFVAVTGYSRDEAIGQTPRLLKSGQQSEVFYRDLWATISSGRTWQGRITNKRKDGTLYVETATLSPVLGTAGNIVNYVAIKRDITEHLQLEIQFQQAQKMDSVGRLAGGVAHDFNNMLTAILGHTDLALDNLTPEHPLYLDLQEVQKAAKRSAALTQQLLAFSRKQAIVPKVLDLNVMVEGMLKMLRRLIGEDIELTWMPGNNLWPIKMDPSQIDQIFANLCINARDAIGGVGRVTLETRNLTAADDYCVKHADLLPGEYVLLSVNDTGCGMDQETQDHIFEPFFTTKAVGEGTGLGLATVYGIVKQNHGHVNVYSEPGRGATFTLYLPRHQGETAQSQANGPVAPVPQGHETILLVEDDQAILKLITKMLADLGYTVLASSTPDEAIRLAKEQQPEIQLLITDVIMPKMNGFNLAQKLISFYPKLPRLFMSGYTADVIASHGGVLNAEVNFIQKPFTKQDLAVKIRAVLDQD